MPPKSEVTTTAKPTTTQATKTATTGANKPAPAAPAPVKKPAAAKDDLTARKDPTPRPLPSPVPPPHESFVPRSASAWETTGGPAASNLKAMEQDGGGGGGVAGGGGAEELTRRRPRSYLGRLGAAVDLTPLVVAFAVVLAADAVGAAVFVARDLGAHDYVGIRGGVPEAFLAVSAVKVVALAGVCVGAFLHLSIMVGASAVLFTVALVSNFVIGAVAVSDLATLDLAGAPCSGPGRNISLNHRRSGEKDRETLACGVPTYLFVTALGFWMMLEMIVSAVFVFGCMALYGDLRHPQWREAAGRAWDNTSKKGKGTPGSTAGAESATEPASKTILPPFRHTAKHQRVEKPQTTALA